MDILLLFGFSAVAVVFGFLVGRHVELRHLADLDSREAALASVRVDSFPAPGSVRPGAQTPALVFGEAVVASDAFKTWASNLRNVFGGEARNYTRLDARARREATVRMLESARALGFDAVCNVRYLGVDVGGNAVVAPKRNVPMAACCVSGTAYVRG